MRSVLFVGNLVGVKGVDRLLRAWAGLGVEAKLVLIGDGPLRGSLEHLAADLGIADSVEFLGRIPHAEIADWMRRSHCLCLCSLSEGMPNVVVEALSCGCPVVATDVGEVPFLIEDGVNGYRVAHKRNHGSTQIGTDEREEVSRRGAESAEEEIVEELRERLRETLSRDWDREAIAARMADYTWEKAARIVTEGIESAHEIHERA